MNELPQPSTRRDYLSRFRRVRHRRGLGLRRIARKKHLVRFYAPLRPDQLRRKDPLTLDVQRLDRLLGLAQGRRRAERRRHPRLLSHGRSVTTTAASFSGTRDLFGEMTTAVRERGLRVVARMDCNLAYEEAV